jgi:surface antigen
MLNGSRFVLTLSLFLTAVPAQAHLQCVPYARSISGIAIHGDARTWWEQAEAGYQRGEQPRPNAVLVFQPTSAMPLGHIAVVGEIIDERHILLNHANWSKPGMIERRALAVDISDAGDWSKVRVWYGPTQSLGARSNPTLGFIYATTVPLDNANQMIAAEHNASTRPKDDNRSG